jgi:hypothetical protein
MQREISVNLFEQRLAAEVINMQNANSVSAACIPDTYPCYKCELQGQGQSSGLGQGYCDLLRLHVRVRLCITIHVYLTI